MIERYTRPEMGKIWTPENRYQAWLRVELAVCEAWNRVGEISDADMETLRKEADFTVDRAFVERANEIEETTRHDVIAFLTAIEEKVGPVSRFIHLGCTSSDIVDTAGSLLMVEAGELILKAFDRVLAVLKKMALEHQGLLCMGRTHGIHAEPTSFSLKMAGFYAEFKRDRARFAAALDDMRVGKLSGAVGTYTVLSPEVEAIVCGLLGLKVDEVSTQVIQRDRHAAYFTALAVTAGTIERLCVELRHLQRTEVREVEEGFGKGQKGSSAMPHKKNPISAENMTGLSRLIRTNALAALENQALWHERDISHSSVERVIMPDSTILTDYVLHRLCRLLEGLRIMPENMARNLACSFGLYFSQRVLTALIETGIPRQEAYVMVQRNAMKVWEDIQNAVDGPTYRERLEADDEAMALLSQEKLDEIFDPWDFLTRKDVVFDRLQELEF